jgi:hypothetical protein
MVTTAFTIRDFHPIDNAHARRTINLTGKPPVKLAILEGFSEKAKITWRFSC